MAKFKLELARIVGYPVAQVRRLVVSSQYLLLSIMPSVPYMKDGIIAPTREGRVCFAVQLVDFGENRSHYG